jgi:hypothetical protein
MTAPFFYIPVYEPIKIFWQGVKGNALLVLNAKIAQSEKNYNGV